MKCVFCKKEVNDNMLIVGVLENEFYDLSQYTAHEKCAVKNIGSLKYIIDEDNYYDVSLFNSEEDISKKLMKELKDSFSKKLA